MLCIPEIKIVEEVVLVSHLNQACRQIDEIQLSSKQHECALSWSDKCAYCEFGFDELKQKIVASHNEQTEEQRNQLNDKIEETATALQELKDEFESDINSKLKFVEEDIEIESESLRSDLKIYKEQITANVDRIEEEMCEKIIDELTLIKELQLNELSHMNSGKLKELLERNTTIIQQFYDFKLHMRYTPGDKRKEEEFQLKLFVYSNKALITGSFLLCQSFNSEKCKLTELMNDRVDHYCRCEAIIDLNKRFYAVFYQDKNYRNKFDAIEKSTNKIFLTEECDYIKGLDDGKVIKVLNGIVTLMDENMDYVKEACFHMPFCLIESINENLMVAIKENCAFYMDFSKKSCNLYLNSEECIKGIKKLCANRIAFFTNSKIFIADLDGELIRAFEDVNGKYDQVERLSDMYLIASFTCNTSLKNCVQIWNYELGVLDKSIANSVFVGIVPFGFLLNSNDDGYPLSLCAYDNDLKPIGSILTDSISGQLIKRVTFFQENLYAFQYGNKFKIIKCENYEDTKKRNDSHFCALKWSKRCAFCEINYNEDEERDLKPKLIKSLDLFEEAKKECFKKAKNEISRIRQELIVNIEKQREKLLKIADRSSIHIKEFGKRFLKHIFKSIDSVKVIGEKNNTPLQKFEMQLQKIQRHYVTNYDFEFDYDSFKINPDEYRELKFTLKQKAWDLMSKYFDASKQNRLSTINGGRNRIIEEYCQVADNKIAVLFRTSFEIYNVANGGLLMTIPKGRSSNHKLLYIEDKYVIIYDTIRAPNNKKHKMLVINLQDLNCYGTNISCEITSVAYLKNGYLIVGGGEISVWNVNNWPFVKIKSHKTTKLSEVRFLLSLTDNTFASADYQTICFWNYDMNLVKKIETEHRITGLKTFDEDKFLVITEYFFLRSHSLVLICNRKSGEILNEFDMRDSVYDAFQTPDKVFLVLTGLTNIVFYYVNGSYVYFDYEMPEEMHKEQHKLKILKDSKFGRLINSNRAIELFNYMQ